MTATQGWSEFVPKFFLCNKCKEFSVPQDVVGEALMRAHLNECNAREG